MQGFMFGALGILLGLPMAGSLPLHRLCCTLISLLSPFFHLLPGSIPFKQTSWFTQSVSSFLLQYQHSFQCYHAHQYHLQELTQHHQQHQHSRSSRAHHHHQQHHQFLKVIGLVCAGMCMITLNEPKDEYKEERDLQESGRDTPTKSGFGEPSDPLSHIIVSLHL